MNATTTKEPIPEVLAKEMAADRVLRREERQALTAIPASNLAESPSRTSFVPQSMGEAMQLATIMSRSTFVPAHCRANEGNCLAIIMQASRWGMDPFAVANKAYFVKDGAPAAFESQLINAVVNSSGALSGRLRISFEGQNETLRCTVRGFLRADPDDEKIRTQSISRITVRNSPLWKSDPEQQLAYYTTRAWARLHCPEVLLGVYTPDEVEVDPERARVVSAPMPRRADVMNISGQNDAESGDEEDEQIARELDANFDPKTGEFVSEGRSDEQHGDQHDGSDDTTNGHPAYLRMLAILAELETKATVIDQDRFEKQVADEINSMCAMEETAEFGDKIVEAFTKRKAALKGGK
jgi:hypothetical protein